LSLLQTLKDDYSLARIPKVIECLDISHFGWEHTSGGLTGMVNGVIAKSRYKRYKISEAFAWDDYASLKEVLQRRFKSIPEKADYPDLFVIDGGVWQLGVVRTLREEDANRARRTQGIMFVWLWKWKARARKWKQAWEFEVICSFSKDWTIDVEPLSYNDSDTLLVRLRDEAHRFANAYRKKQASKTRER
jgi:excinuclease ABC subunit C